MPGNGQNQVSRRAARAPESHNIEPAATPATSGDLAAVATLGEAALAEKQDQRGGALLLRTRFADGLSEEAIAEAIQNKNKMLWLGRLAGASVGFAQAELTELNDGGLIAEVQVLYVMPGARGVGVGESLMKAVLDWAEASGAEGVDSLALPGDRATKNFFEQFGLKARAIVVHRSLAEVKE